ncbi:MAG: 3-methyl-2-oxobutanoate hydroxymethyltransferase, partial [Firmicutes bacterium]|nr:3-methyl-2-oxobutanoate hydroxymethyltransferase [Bacillota bacterium]
MVEAVRAYGQEVKAGTFPAKENTFTMDETIIAKLRESTQ